MSPRQWLALLCFYVSYLIFGASIFYHIEHGIEAEKRAFQLDERIEVNGKYLNLIFFERRIRRAFLIIELSVALYENDNFSRLNVYFVLLFPQFCSLKFKV